MLTIGSLCNVKNIAELRLLFIIFDLMKVQVDVPCMVTHCKHVMTVCKITRSLVYLFQRFLYRVVYFTYTNKHKALTSYH